MKIKLKNLKITICKNSSFLARFLTSILFFLHNLATIPPKFPVTPVTAILGILITSKSVFSKIFLLFKNLFYPFTTIFTNLFGTTITFTISFPSTAFFIFSESKASFSYSSFGSPIFAGIVSRIFPFI